MIYKLLVNAITLLRILLSFAFTYFILKNAGNLYLLTALFFLIGLSDFIDGKLARKYEACTKGGAVLDVFADLLFMISASGALIMIEAFPAWMLAVILVKFIEFWCTSSYARKSISYNKNTFMFDTLGRKIAVLFYLLPYLSIVLNYAIFKLWSPYVLNVLCVMISLGAIVSSARRIKVCLRRDSRILHINF